MAPRVKTLETTLEKLHRQPDLHSLGQIRDLAGLRVVVFGTRADQDAMAVLIANRLSDDGRAAKLIDRRADPGSAIELSISRSGGRES